VVTVGSVVAGYRIERVLGSGGMGAVYLAANPTLPRYDALKVLSAELSRDPDFRARFIREADVASALDHPNIVSVYNRGQTGDELWIAMQFVDGTDADAALRAGTMTPDRAVHIIGEVAKALDHAHQRNVVHRDVKPANFLLSGPAGPNERVLLGDFGIARALDDVGLTVTGSVLATVAYAAPEVLSGLPFDGRADLYSLGCTLFRLLTGETPFYSANGMMAVMMAHIQQPPPRVTDIRPSLPGALDNVIAIAMSKNPGGRFGSASELARAAAAALHDPTARFQGSLPPVPSGEVGSYPRLEPSSTPWWQLAGPPTMMAPAGLQTQLAAPPAGPAPVRRRRRTLIGAALGVGVVVAAGVAVVAWPDGGSRPTVDRTLPATASPATAPTQSPAVSSEQGPPATDVSASALRPILLTAAEIPGNTGADAVVLEHDSPQLLNDSSTIDNQNCLSAWAPAQQPVYADSGPLAPGGPTGAAVQVLLSVSATPLQNSVIQAVVAMPSQVAAVNFVQIQQQRWEVCAGKALTVTPAGEPAQTWDLGQATVSAGAVTLDATLRGGAGSCQRAIADAGNVVIDVRQCRPPGGADVTALVAAITNKVPQQ
jgi:hypothetical protein